MNLNKFKTLLEEHIGKTLTFEYTKGGYVDPDFHITEIKKCSIEAVNCGGGTEYWDETVIQLYENPYATEMGDPMTTKKALKIIQRVEKERPLIGGSLLRFEYGNQKFHTCTQSVRAVTSDPSKLVVSLGEVKADCKDKEACGISVTPDTVQEKVKCAPGSGCC